MPTTPTVVGASRLRVNLLVGFDFCGILVHSHDVCKNYWMKVESLNFFWQGYEKFYKCV